MGGRIPQKVILSHTQTLFDSEAGLFVLSVARDITQRKRAEESLRRSEERFRLVVEAVKDYAIFMLDPSGRITTWSPGAERLNGYRADEIIGRHFSTFYCPEDLERGKPEMELRVASETGRYEDEGWRLRKDGSPFWANVVITAIRDADAKLIGFAKVTRDQTDRRNAEEALRRSEQHSRLLFEFSPDAVLTCDQEGQITEANARIESLFGYRREELLGQSVEVLIPERYRQTHSKHRSDYTREPRMRPMGVGLELYGRRKDGGEFPVDIMLGPVDTQGGRIVLTVIRDLSERKQYEEALRRSEQKRNYLEEELRTEHSFEEIIGESTALKRVFKHVETVAPTDATVLILGETGTGKELVARGIHNLSARREQTFVKLNCSAIPVGLLESELFGHEKGAFTGAIAQKIGRLELAHQGTLFLDEIGDLPLELQPKILRALQEQEFERLGGTRTIPVNVRLVAATNRDLAKMVNEGVFRGDLYYRLRVFPITVPPLRERREDIPLLVRYFVHRYAKRLNRPIATISSDVMQTLTNWRWPGNVRELENFIERSVILSQGSVLRVPLAELKVAEESPESADSNLEAAEREYILRVLREAGGKIGGSGGAAERLGLKRTTLNSIIKKIGIKRRDYI